MAGDGEVCTHRTTKLTAQLPGDWFVESLDPALVTTRNGLRLQQIRITAQPLDEPLAGSERRYTNSMLPNEVAEFTLGLVEAAPGHANFEVERVEFDEIAGADGYRADATFVDAAGLPKRLRVHGAIIANHVIELWYEAAKAVYYDLDEGVFDRMLETVQVRAE